MPDTQYGATHVYCPVCEDIEQAMFEALNEISADGNYLGGDICCKRCKLVISTIYKVRE